jgi:hypothetical protein
MPGDVASQCVVKQKDRYGMARADVLAHIFDHRLYGEYDGLIESYDAEGFNLVEDDHETRAAASVRERSA